MADNQKSILKDIGIRLQLIRKTLKIRQKEFAGDLGISNSSLSVIEAGNAKPRFELLYNISRKYNVNLYYLLYGIGDMFMADSLEGAVKDKNGDSAEFFRDLLYYFKVSPLVKFKMMSFFREYIAGNDELIQKDINRKKQPKVK